MIESLKAGESKGSERWNDLETYRKMVLGESLEGVGTEAVNDIYYPGKGAVRDTHRTVVQGALLGRALMGQSLQTLVAIPEAGFVNYAKAQAETLRQVFRAVRAKEHLKTEGTSQAGLMSNPLSRAWLDIGESLHPFGKLEKYVRLSGLNLGKIHSRDLLRKAGAGDRLAAEDVARYFGAWSDTLDALTRWAADPKASEATLSPAQQQALFLASTQLSRRWALPMERYHRPWAWTTTRAGRLLTTMKSFGFHQFVLEKDSIFKEFAQAAKELATDRKLAQKRALRAQARAIKLGVVGLAVGTLINTAWKTLTGKWDDSVVAQLADDEKKDAAKILELSGRALLDSGYVGVMLDIIEGGVRLAKGEKTSVGDSVLGFNFSRLAEAAEFLNDMGDLIQDPSAEKAGRKTLLFTHSMVPATRVSEVGRSFGGGGLLDVVDPAYEAVRLQAEIRRAVKDGRSSRASALLRDYQKVAVQMIRKTKGDERKRWINTVKRLQSARVRGNMLSKKTEPARRD
jgi:hypothetical protein